MRNLKIFRKIFAYLQKKLQKTAHFKKSLGEGKLQQKRCNLCRQLDENRALQKINQEKCVNFADFQQINHIFTQLIAKKGVSFADFRENLGEKIVYF